MTGSWKGRGNQYIQFVKVLYCKLLTNGIVHFGFIVHHIMLSSFMGRGSQIQLVKVLYGKPYHR